MGYLEPMKRRLKTPMMTATAGLLSLATFGFAPRVHAAEQHLIYDLAVEGAAVGTREVTIKYYSRPSGERHVIETFTHLVAPGVTFDSRGTGLSTPSSAQFSSATDRNGSRSAVAARELPQGGWQVTVQSGGKETDRNETEVRVSTLDLMDPARIALLDAPGSFGLIIAETGDAVVGTLSTGEPGTVKIGGVRVPVTRYTLAGSGASARFMISGDGLLVSSEVRWLGLDMVATLRDLPAARDYGVVETTEGLGSGVQEGDL